MQIDALMLNDGPTIYYDEDFRNVMEDHMTLLRTSATTQVIAVDPGKAYKYEFDLWGFLTEYNVPVELHWIAMRMNQMTSPMDFGPAVETMLIPDPGVISKIQQSHSTTRVLS